MSLSSRLSLGTNFKEQVMPKEQNENVEYLNSKGLGSATVACLRCGFTDA